MSFQLPHTRPISTATTRAAQRAVWVALVSSVLVSVVEVVLGLLSGLVSLVAEGLHTAADAVDSVIVLAGVRKAATPADRSHPYGHGKFETLAAAVEGIFVAAAAVGIFWATARRAIAGQLPQSVPMVALAAMGAASVFYFFVSRWLIRQAKATRSVAVHAEAYHLRTHIIITAGICGGLTVARLGGPDWLWLDLMLATGVGVVLLQTAVVVLRPALGQLTDTQISPEEMQRVRDCLKEFAAEFIEIHELRGRGAGPQRHIDAHLILPTGTTVEAAHDLQHRIQQRLNRQLPNSELLLHVEPQASRRGDQTALAGTAASDRKEPT